jgi:hypothetical protein
MRHRKVTFGRVKSQLLRPRKSEADKRRRQKVWKKRLLALGVAEARIDKLTPIQMRDLLKRPKRIKV